MNRKLIMNLIYPMKFISDGETTDHKIAASILVTLNNLYSANDKADIITNLYMLQGKIDVALAAGTISENGWRIFKTNLDDYVDSLAFEIPR